MTKSGQGTLGRYRLVRRLARGGMAEVYLGRSEGAHGFTKHVAIKRILPKHAGDPQFINMLVDEARIAVLLSHPNIAQILEFGEQDGDYFIVMEHVPGESLSRLVRRLAAGGERLDNLEACFVVAEVLQGLHAAHVQKDTQGKPARIIHRDVSPQNVLISYDGHIKLIDFGIARARDRLEHTEAGTIKGKLRYLAPEMIDPERFSENQDFDHRIDVFAAGIILYELVAGDQLFAGDDENDVYRSITDDDIPDLAVLGLCDPGLMRIINKGLARYPSQRFPTAEAFANALRAYLYSKDPSFTAARLGEVMSRVFADEKAAIENLEGLDEEDLDDAPRELTFGARPSPQAATAAARSRALNPDAALRALLDPPSVDSLDSLEPEPPSGEHSGDSLPPQEPTATGWGKDAGGGQPAKALAPDPAEESTVALVRGQSADASAAAPVSVSGGMAIQPRGELTEEAVRRAFSGPRWGRVAVQGIVLGALLAALGVFAFENVDQSRPRTTTGTPAVTAAPTTIPVLVDAEPHDAALLVDGEKATRTLPAILMARPGDALKLTFSAPGHVEQTRTFEVPMRGTEGRVSVSLTPLDVPLVVNVDPADAEVFVDGSKYEPGRMVAPLVDVKIRATKTGFDTVEVSRRAEAGQPLEVEIKLEPEVEVAADPAKKPRGTGTLVITSQPYWGRVTVDGETLDEVTPTTVKLRAGIHNVRVTHPPKGLTREFKVRIKAGKTTKRRVTF